MYRFLFLFVCMWIYCCASTIYWKDYSFYTQNCFCPFVKDHLTICESIYRLSILSHTSMCLFFHQYCIYSVSLIFGSFLSPILHCLENYSFKLIPELELCQSSDFVVKIVLLIPGLLPFHIILRISWSIFTKKLLGFKLELHWTYRSMTALNLRMTT